MKFENAYRYWERYRTVPVRYGKFENEFEIVNGVNGLNGVENTVEEDGGKIRQKNSVPVPQVTYKNLQNKIIFILCYTMYICTQDHESALLVVCDTSKYTTVVIEREKMGMETKRNIINKHTYSNTYVRTWILTHDVLYRTATKPCFSKKLKRSVFSDWYGTVQKYYVCTNTINETLFRDEPKLPCQYVRYRYHTVKWKFN